MISLAHIIHPVITDESSDLKIAQPVTFATMKVASEFARESVIVRLYAIQYNDEDIIPLPQNFMRVRGLNRSITDRKVFKEKRKLALIKDILDALYAADHADYFIYTNTDIALQPFFYQTVSSIIASGYDSFVINRRTIPEHYKKAEDIPLMCAEVGEPHPGYDCFVFRRDIYPLFKLGSVCIGTAWIGRTLVANMVAYSDKFKEFRDAHLTFHIGDSMQWRQEKYFHYFQENQKEYLKIFKQLESERGEFESLLRSYLLDTGDKRKIPDFDKFYNEKDKVLRSENPREVV